MILILLWKFGVAAARPAEEEIGMGPNKFKSIVFGRSID
jgi:hypothetical protein